MPSRMSTEQDPLLAQDHVPPNHDQENDISHQSDDELSICHTPLVAFFSTFGMNVVAASSVFVFARILCKDPSSCSSEERQAFSGTLTNATIIANVCAILVIQPLNSVSKKRSKVVLLFWLVCRSSAIGLLWVAARSKSIGIVLLSKVLEGTATDNILQFALSTIYARSNDPRQFSTLMSESMAFSLLGSSLGPVTAGLCNSFSIRILISICAMSCAVFYVGFLTTMSHGIRKPKSHPIDTESFPNTVASWPILTMLRGLWDSTFSHLSIVHKEPIFLVPSLSLMVYTMGQAYVLPALMVYTSGRYGFTDRQNSWLLSLATAVSASFVFAIRLVQRKLRNDAAHVRLNIIVAVMGISALMISLPFIAYTQTAWQIYLVVVMMSLGFSSSSFIKTYALCQLQHPKDGAAALAIFETVGSFLSPLTLGFAQTHWPEGKWTIVSSAMSAAAIIMLCAVQMREMSIRGNYIPPRN
ncbi:unnamed protein product [Periconia digitata]|uniref:MFS transporter n=1 Tax=Periconia digitata TaxID=1303443 RepID=A0A9W4UJB7_9PLEO|nr:unnamed protein product [Periconia digitata]